MVVFDDLQFAEKPHTVLNFYASDSTDEHIEEMMVFSRSLSDVEVLELLKGKIEKDKKKRH